MNDPAFNQECKPLAEMLSKGQHKCLLYRNIILYRSIVSDVPWDNCSNHWLYSTPV